MFVYAHRGASEEFPENTLAAFAAALDEGADGLETDLRLTRDGVIVLSHDEKPKGSRLKVAASAFAELCADAPGLATLEDLLALAQGKTRLNLEIKDPAVVPLLVRHIRGDEDVLITSFHREAVEESIRLLPAVAAGIVLSSWNREAEDILSSLPLSAVSLKRSALSEKSLSGCRDAGVDLLVWVVNSPGDAKRLAGIGIDGIFTDAPARIIPALRGGQI